MSTPEVYAPVKVEVVLNSPTDLTKLLLFCHDNKLYVIPSAAANFTPLLFDKTLRKPTKAFAELCGPEWMTPKKEISADGVYQFLKTYIHNHGLRDAAGAIRFDRHLLAVFTTAPPQPLYDHQLYNLVEELLLPA